MVPGFDDQGDSFTKVALPELWKELAQELIKDCQIQQRGNCKLLQQTNKENSAPCHYQMIAKLVPEDCKKT